SPVYPLTPVPAIVLTRPGVNVRMGPEEPSIAGSSPVPPRATPKDRLERVVLSGCALACCAQTGSVKHARKISIAAPRIPSLLDPIPRSMTLSFTQLCGCLSLDIASGAPLKSHRQQPVTH